MIEGLVLLAVLCLLARGGAHELAPAGIPSQGGPLPPDQAAADARRRAAQAAQQAKDAQRAASTPTPWPQVVPAGLPAFPGSGWVPDEPPPKDVVTRAYQLLPELWASGGSGTFKTEKIGERWITFRAELVKGGKKGVVAYRLTSPTPATQALPAPVPVATIGPIQYTPAAGPQVPRGTPAPSPPPPSPAHASTAPPAPMTAPTGTATSVRTLKLQTPYMKGDDVITAQVKLGVSPTDGVFGPATKAAVVKYQQGKGLTADGIIGPQTWRALMAW